MSSAPFLSRHLGHYLLMAQLSEDAMGSVFRALYAADERRFVRLRILRSEELQPEAIDAMIRQHPAGGESPTHSAIVDRSHLDIVQGIPFLTWDETSGWTLDTMLSRVRAFGIRIPAEYALLIAERIAAALEHAHGMNTHHGLLWPGFVSISHDAAVRVGGFGLADGIVPFLSRPRLASEIAPYVASEVRAGGAIGAKADVYALGAILGELLTGRRPSLDTPFVELRAGDPRSEELGAFLSRCMAPPEERFASAIDAHREIQRMVTGNPFSLYTANLSLFLYKLLNPESQLTAPFADWESTNPVVVSASSPEASTPEPVAAVATASVASVEEMVPSETPGLAAARADAVAPLEAVEIAEPPAESIDAGALLAVEELLVEVEPSRAAEPVLSLAAPSPEPIAVAGRLEETAAPKEDRSVEAPSESARPSRPVRLWATAWTRPAGALATAAGVTVAAFLIVGQFHDEVNASTPHIRAAAGVSLAKASVAVPNVYPAPRVLEASAATAAPVALVLSGPSGKFETAQARPARPVHPSKPIPLPSRQPAEDLRLRAALARVEADRWNAKESAGDIFGEGRHSEEEGERLLQQRDYDAAQLAFGRAARLFQKAQEISWEERLRRADLTSGQ